jgi:hypothetical protein
MKTLRRYPDWQVRLEAFVRERRGKPFAWGSHDCALFAADCVEALTGERLLPNMRGYSTAKDALLLIEKAGGLRGIACHALGGFIAPKLARPGDLVLLAVEGDHFPEALGVCNGSTALAQGERGVVAVPMAKAVAAWRVG